MSTPLNIFSSDDPGPDTGASLSPQYLEAINAARFVKGFGITALIYSLLLFLGINLLGAGIGLGTGLFILRYDQQKYYRVLGIIVIVAAILVPISFLSPVILSAGVLWKGGKALQTFGREGSEDDDWQVSKTRALIGTICSAIGLLFSLLFLALIVMGVLMAVLSKR